MIEGHGLCLHLGPDTEYASIQTSVVLLGVQGPTDLQKLLKLLRIVLNISDNLDGYFLPAVRSFVQVPKGTRGNLALKSNFARLKFPVIHWGGYPCQL